MPERQQQPASALDQRLLALLEYRVVLGALATTLDGLVISSAGLDHEDAELLAAASSGLPDDQPFAYDTTRGGRLHVLRGRDIRLVVLTDHDPPPAAVEALMSEHLAGLEEALLL